MRKTSTLSKILSLTPRVEDSKPSKVYKTHGGKSTQEIEREKRSKKFTVRANSPVREHIRRGECRSNPEYAAPVQAVAYELKKNPSSKSTTKLSRLTDHGLEVELRSAGPVKRKQILMEMGRRVAKQMGTGTGSEIADLDAALRKARRNPSKVTKALLDEYVLDYQGKKYKVRWTPEEKRIFSYLWMNHSTLAKHVLNSPASKHGELLREFMNTGDIDNIIARHRGAVPSYVRDASGKITGLATTARWDAVFGKRSNPCGTKARRSSPRQNPSSLPPGASYGIRSKDSGTRMQAFVKAGSKNREVTSIWASSREIDALFHWLQRETAARGIDASITLASQAGAFKRGLLTDFKVEAHKARRSTKR